jgi:nitrite reductase/ring-hydroxylating ferredoxin subunit
MSEPGFVKVAKLSDFDRVGCITVQAEGHTLALFKYDEAIYAVDNRCPHMGFPLSKGLVSDGILTCYWHYARFDLASGGAFDQFADDVPAFPVETRDGDIYVDLTPEPDKAGYFGKRLQDGLERDLPLVVAKAVLNLLEAGVHPNEPFRIGLDYGTKFRNGGWGQGLTILTCLHNLLPYLSEADRPKALYQGLAAVTRETTGSAPRFMLSPLPGETPSIKTLTRWFRQFIEVRDDEGAERCIVSALAAGAGAVDMAEMLFAAATDHRYIDIGHPLDFTNKAFDAIDNIGWNHAGPILTSLVRGYAQAGRMEENNAWRHPFDLIGILDKTFEKLEETLESGRLLKENWSWPRSLELLDPLFGDDPEALAAALLDALAQGCSPLGLAQIVSYAAVLRIARFHTSNEFGDWDTALHTFTFANAVQNGLLRIYSQGDDYRYCDLLRGVFDAAMSVYLDRFLNIPAARLPQANGPVELVELNGLLDRQQQVNEAGALVAGFLHHSGNDHALLAKLGELLLREDRDFHTIQTVEAAIRQYELLSDRPERVHALVAAARYLAAHSPTVRAQGQTYQIAVRLTRGENIYEE